MTCIRPQIAETLIDKFVRDAAKGEKPRFNSDELRHLEICLDCRNQLTLWDQKIEKMLEHARLSAVTERAMAGDKNIRMRMPKEGLALFDELTVGEGFLIIVDPSNYQIRSIYTGITTAEFNEWS